MTMSAKIPNRGLDLKYPMSLGVYQDYVQAQQVVDFLSDNAFEVQNVAIVGTELKLVERVTGRLTRGKVAIAGAISGLWMGLFIGLVFAIFATGNTGGFIISAPLFGLIFGLVWSQVGFAAVTRGGTRDFSSISQVIATKYEVLVEHTVAEKARTLLTNMPGHTPSTF
jgi:hypothetical protein